ncbi:MAG: cysteine desulfurase, partial [Proteobacteria bacterium]|nr:cysteine desulfurase [Pseudomonadota bacterium]
FGRAVRRAVEDAREAVAALVGAAPADVVFTSGGTEANNLALRGAGRERILVSAVEHESVLMAGAGAALIPVDSDGVVDLDALDSLLAGEGTPALVSVMLANNETGVVQPVAGIAEVARRFGALVHCDAVQAAGKIPVDMGALGVDMVSLSAHKIGGPAGIGALVVADSVPLSPIVFGGGQERGRRMGTENFSGIAGFGAAAREAGKGVDGFAELGRLRDALERRILAVSPGTRIFGAGAGRLPNTSCLTMPGMASETQVMALDLAGVAVSAGSACSSGKVQASHVLAAMNADAAQAASAIRASLGWNSTAQDVDRFVDAWTALHVRAEAGQGVAAPAA